MIPVTCPCCEATHRPHNTGCTYAADCPSEEADWAEVASLRRAVVLLNKKVEALKTWDDISVRVNNEHAKTQACLRAEVEGLRADVRRHRMTAQERACCFDAAHDSHDNGAFRVIMAYLDRTAPPAES